MALLFGGQNAILARSEGSTTTHHGWGFQAIQGSFDAMTGSTLYPSRYINILLHAQLTIGYSKMPEGFENETTTAMRNPISSEHLSRTKDAAIMSLKST